MAEEVLTFLDHPWIKHLARSDYMVKLLRFLTVGRKTAAILAKFRDIPESYVLGALEALESLGVVRSLNVGGETFYVLTEKGRAILTYVEDLRRGP